MRADRLFCLVGATLVLGVAAGGMSVTSRAADPAPQPGADTPFDPGPADFGSEVTGTPQSPGARALDSEAPAGLDLSIPYKTVFAGLADPEDPELDDLIEASSQLKSLEGKPTATFTGLTRRAEGDVERLEKVLRSEGYYDGKVTFDIDEAVTPAVVTVTIAQGSRYTLAGYEVRSAGDARIDIASSLKIGMPAEAAPIAAEQTRLVAQLRDRGYPFARVADRVATIDRERKTLSVVLTVDAGRVAQFGPAEITGLERLDPGFVRGKVPWREGDPYRRSKVDDLRTTLLGLGLFSSVKVEPADKVRPDGSLPMTIALVEAKRRSIGAGGAYSTSEGFLLDVFWEHRNLFGKAESLRITGEVGTITQSLTADFRKPDFRRLDQDLLASVSALSTNSEAYDETSLTSFLGLERKLSDRWRASAGGSFELSTVTDTVSTETVQLFGTPLKATRDNRDNLLNPTRGSVLNFEVTPYGGHGAKSLTFAMGRVSASSYIALDDRRWIVLAGRARVASLYGETTSVIPANKRLYAGGGGSIRGYEYQKVGPLDSDNDPVGGRSLFEIGAELRLRVTEEIGIVPFVEGGNVWDDNVPQLTDDLRWAAGLGLRYYTSIGPVRVDIAVPIDRRPNVDDQYQLYFSLGQAF